LEEGTATGTATANPADLYAGNLHECACWKKRENTTQKDAPAPGGKEPYSRERGVGYIPPRRTRQKNHPPKIVKLSLYSSSTSDSRWRRKREDKRGPAVTSCAEGVKPTRPLPKEAAERPRLADRAPL